MSKSNETLADALAKAQANMTHAVADKQNAFLGNKYADLASVYEACRGALTEQGIAIVQIFETIDDGSVFMRTSLLKGEERIDSRLPLQWVRDWHSMGSAITYARRYSLSAIVGVAPEDDDGSQAMDAMKKAKTAGSRKSYPQRKSREKKEEKTIKVDPPKPKLEEVKDEKELPSKGLTKDEIIQETAYSILTEVEGAEGFVLSISEEHNPARLPVQVANRIIDLGKEGMIKKVAEYHKELKKKIEARQKESENFMDGKEKDVA